jgi:hypothetical protein
MGGEDNSLLQQIEKKINSPEKFEKVCEFIEENKHVLQILGSVIDIEEVFNGLVEEINNPEKKKVTVEDNKGDHRKGAVVDSSSKYENVEQSWFSKETAMRLTGEISGAVLGTALMPGLGTVFGGILGGKLTTSVAGMF